MFKWLLKKYKDYNMKNHIRKESCFVIPILPKEELIDGEIYETFDFGHQYNFGSDHWYTQYKTKSARWSSEKDCFIPLYWASNVITSYEDFKPLRQKYTEQEEIKYGICSYNPCDVNALDIEQLKEIIYNVGDDTMVESDDIWDKLIDYMDRRGLSD